MINELQDDKEKTMKFKDYFNLNITTENNPAQVANVKMSNNIKELELFEDTKKEKEYEEKIINGVVLSADEEAEVSNEIEELSNTISIESANFDKATEALYNMLDTMERNNELLSTRKDISTEELRVSNESIVYNLGYLETPRDKIDAILSFNQESGLSNTEKLRMSNEGLWDAVLNIIDHIQRLITKIINTINKLILRLRLWFNSNKSFLLDAREMFHFKGDQPLDDLTDNELNILRTKFYGLLVFHNEEFKYNEFIEYISKFNYILIFTEIFNSQRFLNPGRENYKELVNIIEKTVASNSELMKRNLLRKERGYDKLTAFPVSIIGNNVTVFDFTNFSINNIDGFEFENYYLENKTLQFNLPKNIRKYNDLVRLVVAILNFSANSNPHLTKLMKIAKDGEKALNEIRKNITPDLPSDRKRLLKAALKMINFVSTKIVMLNANQYLYYMKAFNTFVKIYYKKIK